MSTTTEHDKKSALDSDLAPLYALAGITDLVAEKVSAAVRARVAESQQRAADRVAALKAQPESLEHQAKQNADAIGAFVRTLPDQLRDFPTQARTQLNLLQQQAHSYRSTAETAYANFAGRGKTVVDGAIVSARHAAQRTQAKGEELADEVAEATAEAVDPLLEQAQETVTQVRRRATGKSATETMTPRSAVKAARTTAEQQATRKAAAQKAAATRAAKKAAAEPAPKPTAKSAAKKGPAKKAAAKR